MGNCCCWQYYPNRLQLHFLQGTGLLVLPLLLLLLLVVLLLQKLLQMFQPGLYPTGSGISLNSEVNLARIRCFGCGIVIKTCIFSKISHLVDGNSIVICTCGSKNIETCEICIYRTLNFIGYIGRSTEIYSIPYKSFSNVCSGCGS